MSRGFEQDNRAIASNRFLKGASVPIDAMGASKPGSIFAVSDIDRLPGNAVSRAGLPEKLQDVFPGDKQDTAAEDPFDSPGGHELLGSRP